MIFLDKLVNKSNNIIHKNAIANYCSKNNPDLAERIFQFRTYQPYVTNCPDKEVKKICWDCKDIQDSLNKVIEVCGEPQTAKSRYLYAMAYGFSRKEYRRKAIYYINYYLDNELYENIYLHRFRNINSSIEERKKEHIYDMQNMLVDLYIKEYEFDKAMEVVEENIEIIPQLPLAYRKKIDILIKVNKVDDAISFLKNFKKSKYYCNYKEYTPNTWMIDTIDELLEDCESKKKNNYIYNPRKTTIKYIE